MGSGLILLVIVAAWLAVLVPMALRSHEASASQSSVDRFSDAMRVLSRRDAVARVRARFEADDDPLSAAAYEQGQDDDEDLDWDDDGAPSRWRERLSAVGGHVRALPGRARGRWVGRRRSTPAVRRRRLLVTLVLATAACLAGGVVGPRWLLAAAGALLAAVGLFVVQLRRLSVQRAAAARRQAAAAAPRRTRPGPAAPAVPPAAAPGVASPGVASSAVAVPAVAVPAASGSVRVQPADVPAPVREEPLPTAVPAAAPAAAQIPAQPARVSQRAHTTSRIRIPQHTYAPPAAALGEAWSPVPVPVPTYVTAPVAPARAPRIVDLTRPGAWTPPEASRPLEELPGTEPLAEPVPERRRAVNEW